MPSAQSRAELRSAVSDAVERFKFSHKPALEKRTRKRKAKPRVIYAYDLETTRIEAGTPRPLYLTLYGAGVAVASPVKSMQQLTALVRAYFLTPENIGASFVAWNANRFDAYFIAACLVREADLVIRPYMTKSRALRGMRVIPREHMNDRNPPAWEFLDGIAMTGLVGTKLEKFVATFAPDFPKLTGTIDFESETFDPTNADHCAYAMRDSEGLWHAMQRAQQILLDNFNQPLGVTMGGACIRILQAHMPDDVKVESLTPNLNHVVSSFVMRGGFCYCVRRYDGPVWKYDINQAYAAAMREAALPCGGALYVKGMPPPGARVYVAHVRHGAHPSNTVPFYYRHHDGHRLRTRFDSREILDTWLTSIEVHQLVREGWTLDISECWVWSGDGFTLADYVDRLERIRTTCEGGPSGAIGTMVKAVGNHSYGKTVEIIEPIEYVISAECPPDYQPLYPADDLLSDPIEHIYWRIDDDRKPKDYHQPQIGAFITAHVRMVLRRAALLAPDAWLYADTDCAIFSRDVSHLLDIDPKRYGAWKIEEEGARYQIIAKKVYTQVGTDKPKRSAKGMNVKRLTADDFSQWYDGAPPVQTQTQINNFLAVMQGAEMYRSQSRRGTAVEITR